MDGHDDRNDGSVSVTVPYHVHGLAARRSLGNPLLLTGMFLLGYVLVWTGFSAIAAAVQLALQAASLLSHTSASLTPVTGGALLIAAGVFQWTPAKHACLRNCRSPVGFLFSATVPPERAEWD
jgi:predicted metal-binding membrane protein